MRTDDLLKEEMKNKINELRNNIKTFQNFNEFDNDDVNKLCKYINLIYNQQKEMILNLIFLQKIRKASQ